MPAPEILIAGTGAMACLFGARLSPHADVTLLGSWTEGLAALQHAGIRLEAGGLETRHPVRVTSDPLDCRGARFALVLVKSWQTRRTAEMLAECLAPDGVALTLQNGLGNLEILQQVLGDERAALGVTTMGATLRGPGLVRAGGIGPTYVGRHPRVEAYLPILSQAGFMVEVEDDVESLLWGKLAVNAGINPLTALLGVPNGELLDDPDARAVMGEAARETASVAVARGVRLPYLDPVAQVEAVAERTRSNQSSMLQDMLRGALTEIDAINGAVTAAGDAVGVATPVNRTLWRLVRAAVARRGAGSA
ncbi:MAG TPA: 2-dehydropantoate 2-reductase [Anaerolineales bacterium]|nr:2-dehydropantoate 2-reductase [Anaerolineales bacterium]